MAPVTQELKMLHLCNFLKMNRGNGNQQIDSVDFVRDTLNTLVLSKLASYENSFWNPMGK